MIVENHPKTKSLSFHPQERDLAEEYPDLSYLNEHVVYLKSNGTGPEYLAVGQREKITLSPVDYVFEELQAFLDKHKTWVFGYLGYDLKNGTESLSSGNDKTIDFPAGFFFVPENLWCKHPGQEWLQLLGKAAFPSDLDSEMQNPEVHLRPQISKENYLESLGKILDHIHYGDVYELNFCQELFADNVQIDPYTTWKKLNELTRAPFASYFRMEHLHLMGASPERYIKKTGDKVISQPIKGTTRRGRNETKDVFLQLQLLNSRKERQENIMITDLVRNDLSKTAMKGTVKVEELCALHTFKTVHQLISTVSSRVAPETPIVDIIKTSFPMGSMTGAPKVKAMELIDKYESMQRGIYSGALGFFSPEGDFDFNVVIRSLMYDSQQKKLSAMVGGAITADSDPEQEYAETMLKAEALLKSLGND